MRNLIGTLVLCSVLLACDKSDTEVLTRQDIVGKWKLIEYYRDIGNGTGEWMPADANDIEIVQFEADGKFIHNENFSIQNGIDRYRIAEQNRIELYSSAGSADTVTYFFRQDKRGELIFNPVCREFSCMKKHVRLQ